jgi:hypothetical protein
MDQLISSEEAIELLGLLESLRMRPRITLDEGTFFLRNEGSSCFSLFKRRYFTHLAVHAALAVQQLRM